MRRRGSNLPRRRKWWRELHAIGERSGVVICHVSESGGGSFWVHIGGIQGISRQMGIGRRFVDVEEGVSGLEVEISLQIVDEQHRLMDGVEAALADAGLPAGGNRREELSPQRADLDRAVAVARSGPYRRSG